jgi:hypothetical protein
MGGRDACVEEGDVETVCVGDKEWIVLGNT